MKLYKSEEKFRVVKFGARLVLFFSLVTAANSVLKTSQAASSITRPLSTIAATEVLLADDGTFQIVSVPYPPFVGAGKKARFFRISVSIAP